MNQRPPTGEIIRVVIADDHEMIRTNICALLAKENDIDVVAQAKDGRQAVEMVEALQPDIVLLDISMPQLDGFQAIDRIKNASTKVIIISMHLRASFVRYAVRSGAVGYIPKSTLKEVVSAIRAVSKGQTYFTSIVLSKL